MYDFAIAELGLKREEFERMTMGDFNRVCYGHQLRQIEESRRLRLQIAAAVGKDPRSLWDLPGDWDDVELDTPEHRSEILHKFNVYKLWGGDNLN